MKRRKKKEEEKEEEICRAPCGRTKRCKGYLQQKRKEKEIV